MDDLYQHLKSEQGKEIIKTGWRAAGITDILKDARMGNGNTIRPNPFVWYKQVYVSYIIIKKFPQIDVKFACFLFIFSCTDFECISVKRSFDEIENSR